MTPPRLSVHKTYKLYVGGAFPRSESGRSYPIVDADGATVAHAVLGSRKDVRDAVGAARGAQPGWAARTGYNRGQILYRVAEMMESRTGDFVDELARSAVATASTDPGAEVTAAIDRWVWYAGWCDKYPQVLGGANPVAGPYFNFSVPEPMGVVGVVAPDDHPLLALVSRIAPALAAGNTVVALASEPSPLVALTLAEALATSDVPGGVVNLLTGRRDELVLPLASHGDVDAVDLTGCDAELAAEAERAAADSVTRVVRATPAEQRWLDASAESPYLVAALCETKTVWHPIGR